MVYTSCYYESLSLALFLTPPSDVSAYHLKSGKSANADAVERLQLHNTQVIATKEVCGRCKMTANNGTKKERDKLKRRLSIDVLST